jgi:hypothetical protein
MEIVNQFDEKVVTTTIDNGATVVLEVGKDEWEVEVVASYMVRYLFCNSDLVEGPITRVYGGDVSNLGRLIIGKNLLIPKPKIISVNNKQDLYSLGQLNSAQLQ